MTLMHEIENELQVALGKSLKTYCEGLSSEKLIQPQDKAAKIQKEVMAQILAYNQLLQEGFKALQLVVEELSVLDRSIDFAVFKKNMQSAFSKLRTRKELERYSAEVVSGKSWSAVLGLTPASIELMYRAGQEIFARKRYVEAEAVFCFLATVDPVQYAFWIGLAHARFHLENYSQALSAYQMASLCDPFALWPYFFSANCYEKQRDFDQARICLEDAYESYKNQGVYDREMEEVIMQRKDMYGRS